MLHIKSHPPNPIEKPFSKTHAPMFGIGVIEKFNLIISTLREML
jgi:hypothetical protein